jgi:hypothetical protein
LVIDDGTALGREAAKRILGRTAEIRPGLTAAEFDDIEGRFGFEFADDHRAFLAVGLPVGGRWPDWRHGDAEQLRSMLGWPVEGVLFDVERNAFWHDEWPTRPSLVGEALELAASLLAKVPQMVPVYSHRYLPAGRGSFGHPVLSMHRTDIIYYGTDLVDYVHQEFDAGRNRVDAQWQPRATVTFWRDLVE